MRKSGHAHAGKPLLTPLVRALREVFKQASHWKPARHSHLPHRDSVPANSIRFEPLEPRVLLSADINPAQTITNQISVPGETDQYGFTLPQDARIVFDSLTNNTNLNWSLTGPTGTLVTDRAFSASDGTAANSLLDLKAGDYTVTVKAMGDTTADYTFRLIDLFRAQEIVPGTVVSGQLDPANATNVYRFGATTGDRFYFDFQSLTGGSATWRLFDPNGNPIFGPLAMNQAGEGEYTAGTDGSYTLVIEGAIGNTGVASYSFNAQKIADDVKTLVPGQSQGTGPQWAAGKLGGALQLDGLQYGEVLNSTAVDLNRTVTLEAWIKADRLAGTWTPLFYKGGGALGTRTYSLWLNANGSLDFSTADASGEQHVDTAAGVVGLNQWQHVAAVMDRSTGQGVLKIYVDGVQQASGAVRTTATAISSTNSLTIGYATDQPANYAGFEGAIDDIRVWSIARAQADIAQGKNAELTGNEAGLAVYLKANDGSGSTLADSKALGSNSALIRPLYDASGVVAGRIDHPGQRDIYNFTLSDATRLYFDSLTNNSALTWSLTGPRGTLISNRPVASDSFDASAGVPVLDLAAGNYTLTLDIAGDSTVSYAFRLLDLAQAPLIIPGTNVSGRLSPARETDLYRFSANAGDRFFFDFISAAGGDTYWRLLDPYGNVVFDRTPFSTDAGLKTLDSTGTYTVIIEGRISAPGEASYTFNAQKIVDDVKPLVLGQSQGTDRQWTAGELSGAAYLDGTQYGEIANSATVNQLRTVTAEAWINADRLPASSSSPVALFYKGGGTLATRTYSLWLNSDGSLKLS